MELRRGPLDMVVPRLGAALINGPPVQAGQKVDVWWDGGRGRQ